MRKREDEARKRKENGERRGKLLRGKKGRIRDKAREEIERKEKGASRGTGQIKGDGR